MRENEPGTNHEAVKMRTLVLDVAAAEFPRHLERLRAHIMQPSVCTQPAQIQAMLTRLSEEVHALAGSVNIVPTKGMPILVAKWHSHTRRTVLVHCMYDTVAADEADWVVPPFSASRTTLEGVGECIIGRGAEDTKGPYTAILNAIASYQAAKVDLPVNILLVMEGSELGSAGITEFVLEHADELRQCDAVYFPWHTERVDRTAVVWLGAKGLVTLKLRVRGGEWGGPAHFDLHGSHANWVASPVDRLVRALADMKSPDGDIAIAGFYDGRSEPSLRERQLVRELSARIDEGKLLTDLGVRRLKQATLAEAIAAYCFKAEFNVSGLKAGAVLDEEFKTQVPREATASLDVRPLPGMSCEKIIDDLRAHLSANGLPEVEIEVGSAYPGGGSTIENWAVGELIATYRDCGYGPEIWPRTARSIAAGLYTETLGLPWIATMPGHAGRQHAANEFISIAGYRTAIEFVIRLLARLAVAPTSQ